MDADARRFYRIDEEFLSEAATEWNEGRTWASGELTHERQLSLSVSNLPLSQARIVYPSPGFAHPSPSGRRGRCKKKNRGEILGCQEFLLICFVHPVLLVLRLAELAALSYSSGMIVAQVVKVRLVAVVAGFNFMVSFPPLIFT